MVTRGRVRADAFVDSVALMQVTERVRALPGVRAAALVMATELNRRVLDETDLWPAEAKRAGPTDLVIVVRAESADAADAALGQAEAFLAARRGDEGPHRREPPRSITGAARRLPGANVALVSVPGAHAAAEAHQALSAGLHVFLFSDGVSLADEIALKQRAVARGLLVMGPECGTSLVNGVGFGFANRVRRGHVGLVAASGTGLQEVSSLIHRLGGGVSQGIGTGGRDLHEAVDGLATLQTLSWLARDPETRVIGLVSKAPSSAVAARVLAAAVMSRKPVVAYLPGWQGTPPPGVVMAATLEAAALGCVRALGRTRAGFARPRGGRSRVGQVLGLFTGGTLCDEARAIVGDAAGKFVDFGEVGVHAGAAASDHRSEPPERGHRAGGRRSPRQRPLARRDPRRRRASRPGRRGRRRRRRGPGPRAPRPPHARGRRARGRHRRGSAGARRLRRRSSGGPASTSARRTAWPPSSHATSREAAVAAEGGLFGAELRVVNAGVDLFADALARPRRPGEPRGLATARRRRRSPRSGGTRSTRPTARR